MKILLPRRDNFIVDRLHVGVRQQAQHAKIVRGCHHIGELLDHVHVAEIPAQNNLRHLQVVLDDKNNSLRLLRRDLEPIEDDRSEEHTSELQSQSNLVCRLLLEKKKKNNENYILHNTL